MFYIGQKIVCIGNDHAPLLVVDKIYTINDIYLSPCPHYRYEIFDVGIPVPNQYSGCGCLLCNKTFHNNSALHPSGYFVPLSEYTANEVAVDELVKESVKNIYQK